MKGTLVTLVVSVCLTAPVSAQFLDGWPDAIEQGEREERSIQRMREWNRNDLEQRDRFLEQTLRNQENRRQEWNRWQQNMRSDDGRQQSWDSPYYENW